MPPSLRLYPQLLEGVFSFVFKPRSYSAQPGSYPLPWLDATARDPYTALPPGQTLDASDYLTGVAVFMRYALQAYRADPALLTPYRGAIFASANGVVRSGCGQGGMPVGDCDAGLGHQFAQPFGGLLNRLHPIVDEEDLAVAQQLAVRADLVPGAHASSSPSASLTTDEVGTWTDPAISNRKPSKSSTVEAIPPA